MSKIKRYFGVLLVFMLAFGLVGCNNSKKEGMGATGEGEVPSAGKITVDVDTAYQYEGILPEIITVEYKGKDYKLTELPDKVEYELVTPVYCSDVVTVRVDGEEYSATLDNYVPSTEIRWTYDGDEYFANGTKSGDLDASKLKGDIDYEDGSSKSVKVEYATVTVADSDCYVTISDGVNTYSWETSLASAKDKKEEEKNSGKVEKEDNKEKSSEDAVEGESNDAEEAEGGGISESESTGNEN